MLRFLGFALMVSVICSGLGEYFALQLPSISWAFDLSRKADWLGLEYEDSRVLWFGWSVAGIYFLTGFYLFVKFWRSGAVAPIMADKFEKFRKRKYGFYSLLFLMFLAGASLLDFVLVGNEALVVKYEGAYTFPAFTQIEEKGSDYGMTGPSASGAPDYRKLQETLDGNDAWLIMPLWPYSPTGDRFEALTREIDVEAGTFSGMGSRLFDPDSPLGVHLNYTFEDGKLHGPAEGWDTEGQLVYEAKYLDGKIIAGSEVWTGEGKLEGFLAASDETLYELILPPSPPVYSGLSKHYLGTNSDGNDVLAYLFGGMRVFFHALFLYVPAVMMGGIAVGLLMSYFGGLVDVVFGVVIEILESVPSLIVVIIVGVTIPKYWKEEYGLYIILMALLFFGWGQIAAKIRATLRPVQEKDYISASRAAGASKWRILRRHLLPNAVEFLIPQIPGAMRNLAISLTALDFLGIGLPRNYPSLGSLLRNGMENFSAPWLAVSAFVCLVCLLLLISLVESAVREAFCSKKHTFYR